MSPKYLSRKKQNNQLPSASYSKSRGLTLIELLIAMLIGLFIMSGVIRAMMDSKDTFAQEQELSFLQENARFIMDELGYEIRMAGYTGCNAAANFTNVLNNVDESDWMYSGNLIKGYEAGDATSTFDDFDKIEADTDLLIVSRGEADDGVVVFDHVEGDSQIDLQGTSDYKKGEILIASSANCNNIAVFQNTSGDDTQIGHLKDVSMKPGNCHGALSTNDGEGFNCDDAPSSSDDGVNFNPGSQIMRFKTTAYFMAESPITGLKTLYRRVLTVADGTPTTELQELVSGVEDFQVTYGVDPDQDGVVSQYVNADDITDDDLDPDNDGVAWSRVINVRLTLILKSTRELLSKETKVDLGDGYVYEGTKYMYQRIDSTVRIRNRVTLFDENV